jgi:hypothetical protein
LPPNPDREHLELTGWCVVANPELGRATSHLWSHLPPKARQFPFPFSTHHNRPAIPTYFKHSAYLQWSPVARMSAVTTNGADGIAILSESCAVRDQELAARLLPREAARGRNERR